MDCGLVRQIVGEKTYPQMERFFGGWRAIGFRSPRGRRVGCGRIRRCGPRGRPRKETDDGRK